MNKLTIASLLMAVIALSAAAAPAQYQSPLTLTTKDGVAYVADYTARSLVKVDLETGAAVASALLNGEPTGVTWAQKDGKLFVTAGIPEGRVRVVDSETMRVLGEARAGHSPTSPVLSADGKKLYVCDRFADQVVVLNTEDGSQLAAVPVPREPIAAALTPDGAFLVVANHLPAGASDGAYSAAQVSIIDTATDSVAASVSLPNGSNSLKGVCISPDGRFAYVTHILARYQLPTTQLERGWMNTNAFSIIDLQSKALVASVLLDQLDRGAANPWGVVCSDDAKHLVVAHAGTHELSLIDRVALHDKLDRLAAGEEVSRVASTLEEVATDLSFLVGLRERIALPGEGPRGLAVADNQAVVAEYFSNSLALVDLNEEATVRAISLGETLPPTPERWGEMLFHDARRCFQNWQSCSSCHPDGRSDALNWDLLNDGMGNPKNSKSLLCSHVTPPAMISGIRPDAETAVRAGMKYIQFAVRPEEEAEAIDAFLKAMEPVPGPAPDAAMVQRGAAVFTRAKCDACHSGPQHTDMNLYNVGTGLGRQADWQFDTPTLTEIWRSAPYLHDGRAATLLGVVGEHNPNDLHGETSQLRESERADLVAYLKSL